ncbi:MAG: hypothetical protein LBD23_06195 [Oscillospiraceae bacterium]|jgi:hypothetical protein|nr:hypothetical protein [Oscillospiraceae bacterium]
MNLNRLNLTTKGLTLRAKIDLGKGDIPLEITRIVAGSGTSTDPLNLTDVIDPKATFTITNRELNGGRAVIEGYINNFGDPEADPPVPPLEVGYSIRQIGVYALDPDVGEILFQIAQPQTPSAMPARSEMPHRIMPIFDMTVGNAKEVIIEINPMQFATRVEHTALVERVTELENTVAYRIDGLQQFLYSSKQVPPKDFSDPVLSPWFKKDETDTNASNL